SYGVSGGKGMMLGGEASIPDEGTAGVAFAVGAQTGGGGGATARRTSTTTTPLLNVRFGSEVKTKAKSGSASDYTRKMWSAMKRSMPALPRRVIVPQMTIQGSRIPPRGRNMVRPNAATGNRIPRARAQTGGPEDIYADLDQEPEDIYEP
ncbi:MAG: hypothetical protein JSU86_06285, partial [Phycisphaerales bacterium]